MFILYQFSYVFIRFFYYIFSIGKTRTSSYIAQGMSEGVRQIYVAPTPPSEGEVNMAHTPPSDE